MLGWALLLGLAGAVVATFVFLRAPRSLRIPLAMFNGFYLLTSVIGAVMIATPAFQPFWTLTLPGMDTRWLSPGETTTYWLLVLGPFVVTNVVAYRLRDSFRVAATGVARNLSLRPSLFAVTVVGLVLIGYCFANLANHGYLGVSLLSGENIGLYRENIQMRAEMQRTLGEMHYGLVYMAIPAVCVVALLRAIETRLMRWWLAFLGMSAAVTLLYMATLTKGNLIVFLLALGVTAYFTGVIRTRGILLAGLGGIVVLTALDTLLTGTGLLEIVATLSNIVFRLSSAIPFYAEVFPVQQPYVGIDYGLQWFGIGPEVPANLVVFNYMFPDVSWVQGAAPAPAHVVGYAQAGLWWSFFTMVLMGVLVAFVSLLGQVARSALARALFVGGTIACYYISQTEFVGIFSHAYGLKWWLLGVIAILMMEMFLRWLAVVPRVCESDTR